MSQTEYESFDSGWLEDEVIIESYLPKGYAGINYRFRHWLHLLRKNFSSDQILFLLIFLVFILLTVWLLGQAIGLVQQIIIAVSDTTIAIIIASTALLGAALKFSSILNHDRKQRAYLAKEALYKEMLDALADFDNSLKNGHPGKDSREAMTRAKMAIMVFGDEDVVIKADRYMSDPTNKVLLFKVLRAMRLSLRGRFSDERALVVEDWQRY